MAIYHHHAQVIGRSGGRSAVAAAAYRSGQKLEMVDGRVLDYSGRHGIVHTKILAPELAADWMKQRETLWRGVELVEKRKDAQLAREVQVSLPRELSADDQIDLVQDYVKQAFVSKGMVADIAIHQTENNNPHAHIMLTMREIDGESFGKKQRDWNGKALLQAWRKDWAELSNEHLARSGHDVKIDHRSLVDQGITREPRGSISRSVYQMEQEGVLTLRAEGMRAADRANEFAKAIQQPNFMIEDAENIRILEQGLFLKQERELVHELSR